MTTIKRPSRAKRGEPCARWLWAKLNDRPLTIDQNLPATTQRFEAFSYNFPDAVRPNRLENAWREHGKGILEDWLTERPGTRPSCWWRFDAPEPLPAGESELDYLRRLDLLQPNESLQIDRKEKSDGT